MLATDEAVCCAACHKFAQFLEKPRPGLPGSCFTSTACQKTPDWGIHFTQVAPIGCGFESCSPERSPRSTCKWLALQPLPAGRVGKTACPGGCGNGPDWGIHFTQVAPIGCGFESCSPERNGYPNQD